MLYQEHSLDRPETVREVTLSPVLQAWTSLLHYIQIIALFLFFKSNRVNLMENYLLKQSAYKLFYWNCELKRWLKRTIILKLFLLKAVTFAFSSRIFRKTKLNKLTMNADSSQSRAWTPSLTTMASEMRPPATTPKLPPKMETSESQVPTSKSG